MSLSSRRELTGVTWPRYHVADRGQKARILDEFVEATGYHRKYAIGLLSALSPPTCPTTRAKKSPANTNARGASPGQRRRTYDKAVERALLSLWEASGHLCSKRLVPFLPELIEALERHGELPALAHGHTGHTSPSEQH